MAAAEGGRRLDDGELPGRDGSLEEGQAAGKLAQCMKALTLPAVLVIDEVGDLRMRHPGDL